MLIPAYLQIDLCLFCATPAVNKGIWRIISMLKGKARLPLPTAHFFLLHFRSKGCWAGEVPNGELWDELNLKFLLVPRESISYPGYLHSPLWAPPLQCCPELVLQALSRTRLGCCDSHTPQGQGLAAAGNPTGRLWFSPVFELACSVQPDYQKFRVQASLHRARHWIGMRPREPQRTWDPVLASPPRNCSYKQLPVSVTCIFLMNSSRRNWDWKSDSWRFPASKS